MNELQDRTDRLLAEPWLERDLTAIEAKAGQVRSRHRRAAVVGALALVVLVGAGAVVAGRLELDGRPSTLDVAGIPDPPYVQAHSDVMVFLAPGIEAPDEDLVRGALVSDPAVGQAWARSSQDAYDEFVCMFADEPKMIESVTPQILPATFDVALVDGADLAAFASRMNQLGGVDEVIVKNESGEGVLPGSTTIWRPAHGSLCDGSPRTGDPIR